MSTRQVVIDLDAIHHDTSAVGDKCGRDHALNASKDVVSGAMFVSCELGKLGLVAGEDFWLDEIDLHSLSFGFRDSKVAQRAASALAAYTPKQAA